MHLIYSYQHLQPAPERQAQLIHHEWKFSEYGPADDLDALHNHSPSCSQASSHLASEVLADAEIQFGTVLLLSSGPIKPGPSVGFFICATYMCNIKTLISSYHGTVLCPTQDHVELQSNICAIRCISNGFRAGH